jgi:hypothetical protein
MRRAIENRPADRAAVAVFFAHSDANGAFGPGKFKKGVKP